MSSLDQIDVDCSNINEDEFNQFNECAQPLFDDSNDDVYTNLEEEISNEIDKVPDDWSISKIEQMEKICIENNINDDHLSSDDDSENDSCEPASGNDNDSSTKEVRELDSTPITQSRPIRMLGRLGKIATDKEGKPLEPPKVIHTIADPASIPKPLRIARLPDKYYISRGDKDFIERRQAYHSKASVYDCRVKSNNIIIIYDKDDIKGNGFEHAINHFKSKILEFEVDRKTSILNQWSFGLCKREQELTQTVSFNLLDGFPEKFNDEQRPFWFTFKEYPSFEDEIFRKLTRKDADAQEKISTEIGVALKATLNYGALTSMRRFHANKDFLIHKKTSWLITFFEERLHIETYVFEKSAVDFRINGYRKRYRITADIIDRTAIIHLRNDGYSIYINMKGNVHEFERRRDNDTADVGYKRIGKYADKNMPLFPTICIQVQLRDDDFLSQLTERSNAEKLSEGFKQEGIKQLKEALKNFLHFFNRNRIQICFGSIFRKTAQEGIFSKLTSHRFPSFLCSYSWAMLLNISYRVQIQLSIAKETIPRLHEYSRICNNETSEERDNIFYRLCLYLHRRTSEYIFLDFDTEILIAAKIFDTKYKQELRSKMKFQSSEENERKKIKESSTAYIPSIIITPTTIRIRPLKLCKLNRVLRENKFGGVLNFALVELRDEAGRQMFSSQFRALKDQISKYIVDGFRITNERTYKYLHHSQSQVKAKQFWFYYHDKENGFLSHDDAYIWMGNFDKERVVAKHTARIALCFTSSDATIRIPANQVTYIRDIKDRTGKYTFSDGVGTISSQLRDQIKIYLNHPDYFSVLQIRYGGCKGTLSVDPRLDNQKYQLVIRDSMNKFTSDHDVLELCKLSAPRSLYLNRQDIILLESRDVPHTNLFQFQNEEQLRLIRSLLSSAYAYELLQQKLLAVFKLEMIARNFNIVQEPFFLQLIITCAFNIMRDLIDRTKIHVSDMRARNMFGIVDEYGVLEYGQVFFQYTETRQYQLRTDTYDNRSEKDLKYTKKCFSYVGKVVVTKNPCHHPGDLRVFDAVYYQELAYLKDVIVFPQKGHRPHSNEISGSDLDGDEYAVIWHEDLIPTTPNETPYDYDSQEDPPKMERPITRNDINQIVLEISEQDCLGNLSNIHLAYCDKNGVKSEVCTKLAGYISQEVDAAKTGKHPLTEEELREYRTNFGDRWPDFMKVRGKTKFYPSNKILGKLYRAARRSAVGWSRAITNYGSIRQATSALELIGETNTDNENTKLQMKTIGNSISSSQILDPDIHHPDSKNYLEKIKHLYNEYKFELLEIISLYRFQDEIDLFCRSDSMDSVGGGKNSKSIEDSASIEVENLVEKTIHKFFFEFVERNREKRCCKLEMVPGKVHPKTVACDRCFEDKLAKAACAYEYTYTKNSKLSTKSNQRILSFPWLFASQLIQLKDRNRSKPFNPFLIDDVGPACRSYLHDLCKSKSIPKFKIFVPINSEDNYAADIFYRKNRSQPTSLLNKPNSDVKISSIPLLRVCFIEILNDWLIKQDIFGETCDETRLKPKIPVSIWHVLILEFLCGQYQTNIELVLSISTSSEILKRVRDTIDEYCDKWKDNEYQKLSEMFFEIHSIVNSIAKRTCEIVWSYLDDYILSALQCIGIEKKLLHEWISA